MPLRITIRRSGTFDMSVEAAPETHIYWNK